MSEPPPGDDADGDPPGDDPDGEADPFENDPGVEGPFGDAAEGDTDRDRSDDTTRTDAGGPFDAAGDDSDADAAPFERLDDASGTGVGDPFEDLEDASDPAVGDPFEEMEMPDLDTEAVFEAALGGDDEDGAARGSGADGVVSKEQYCKKCEHFSEPPETACTNPGTEIVELVGVDSFRLRNCPVVADRRRAESVFPDEE